MSAVLKQVEKQRNGEEILALNIKKIVQSVVSLGLDENNTKKVNLSVYIESFEQPFIQATRVYYEEESKTFLANNSVVEYLKKAGNRFNEEADRIQMYLHPNTEKPLIEMCENKLVADHANVVQNEFQKLLQDDREEDIHRLYQLLIRIPDGLIPIQIQYEAYVKKQGLDSILKLTQSLDGASNVDPKLYAETLLGVHLKYSGLVERSFSNNSDMVKSLDNACRKFINSNAIATPASGGKSSNFDSRTPELLARYTDMLLRKGAQRNLESADIEAGLSGVMKIFQYINEKDAFEKFYSKFLSKRLVFGTSASEEAEASMVSKLKEACGYEYTNKLARMFQDMEISVEMQGQFKDTVMKNIDKEDQNVDFNALVLASNFWPLPHGKSNFNLPTELVRTHERFKAFYNQKHSGRIMTWLWNFCKGDLKVNFAKNSKTGYTFHVSLYQMGLLIPFNTQDTYTVEQLQEITALDDATLSNSMVTLVKARVLLQTPNDVPPGSPNTSYTLNLDFKNKKIRINLNQPFKSEQKAEVEAAKKNLDEDRRLFLQATIVRIMKTRKELRHVQLMQEVIEQSQKRFNPRIVDIKKAIDLLLEKDYIKRGEDNKYQYVA